jgi:uncharacterized protein YukE
MDKIKINTTDLRDAAKDLETIAHEFKDATDNGQTLADAVGEPTLADHLVNFSTNWEQHRSKMLKSVDDLRSKLLEGADELEKADAHLAAELTQSPAPSAATPAPSRGRTQ